MNAKGIIWFGAIVGSTLGGCVPTLWHASFLSFSGVIASAIGAALGIWVGWQISQRFY